MGDLSKVVQGLTYSVANAIDGLNDTTTFFEASGWKSSLDNSSNTVVVQIKFSSERSFNRLSFELLDVPQNFSVFYLDSRRNKFIKIQTFGGYLNGNVTGSKDGIQTQELWKSFRFAFPSIKTSLIEIRMNRITDALYSFSLPNTTRFAVGMKNVQVRFHRVGLNSLNLNEDSEYNIRYFSPNSVLNNASTYWKSPPLGPNSLYPFYVDLRKSTGRGQVVEFMKLVPLFPDSHINLYTSDDESFGVFNISENLKQPALLQKAGTPDTVSTSIANNWTAKKGIRIQSYNYWEISNNDVRMNLSSAFTLGFTYEPANFSNLAKHHFWNISSENDTLTCSFEPTNVTSTTITGTFVVKLNNVAKITSNSLVLNKDTEYGIVLGYNPQIFEWNLTVCPMDTTDITRKAEIFEFNGFYPTKLNFGYDTTSDTLKTVEAGYMKNIWIRQDVYQTNYVNTFFRNSDTFINGWGKKTIRTNGYFNALFVGKLTDDLSCKVGPDSQYFDGKVWTPANKNFVLNSSIYYLGRTNAKFLKIEFAKPTAQYYNPATSEQVALPILDFPDWVKTWYTTRFDSSTRIYGTQYLFEGRKMLQNTLNSYGINALKSSFESSPNSLIYNDDKVGTELLASPNIDEESLRTQIARNTLTLQFPTAARHKYKTYDYYMTNKRAFFYGIVELSFFNSDQTTQNDNLVYFGDFKDEDMDSVTWIDSYDGFFITEDKVAMASDDGDVLQSKTFTSFSDFSSVQIGYIESALKDLIPASQINLVDISHLSRTDDGEVQVVDNMLGSSDGQTVVLQRLQDGYYGIKTSEIETDITQAGVKLVAGCRVRSSARHPQAYYELRLISIDSSDNETIVAKKALNLADDFNWQEIDVVYHTASVEDKFRLEIIQLDSFSTETLYIDMLGLWMARNKWELSNDNGTTWVPVVYNVNNPHGLVAFDKPGNQLKIRVTSQEASSWVSEWMILPVYDFAPVGMSGPRLYDSVDADNPELKSVGDHKFFSPYTSSIPHNYSIITDVVGLRNRIS